MTTLALRHSVLALGRKGFFHLLSANYLVQFLSFGSLLLVGKFVTVEEFGTIRILQSYAAFFLVVAGFGFNTAVLKLCSEARPAEEKARLLRVALRRSLWATVATLGAVAALAFGGVIASSPHLAIWIVAYSLMLPFAVSAQLFTAYLQALKRIKEMANVQGVVKLLSVALVVVATWQWGFAGFVLATLGAYVVGLLPFFHVLGGGWLRVEPGPVTSKLNHFARYSFLANAVSVLGLYGDLLILDHFEADRTEVGYYALATVFAMGAAVVTSTVQALVTPYFSERAGDERWFRLQLNRVQLRLMGLSVLVALGVFAVAFGMIEVLYAPAYAAALPYLAVLLLRYVVWSSYAVLGVAIIALGRMRQSFLVVAVTTPLGLLVAYFFLQWFGIEGVAWAQVVAANLTFALMYLVTRRVLRQVFRP